MLISFSSLLSMRHVAVKCNALYESVVSVTGHGLGLNP
jgi:hypothetical protein